ncbi:hypothetical protein D9M69_442050 [compost metagenome]
MSGIPGIDLGLGKVAKGRRTLLTSAGEALRQSREPLLDILTALPYLFQPLVGVLVLFQHVSQLGFDLFDLLLPDRVLAGLESLFRLEALVLDLVDCLVGLAIRSGLLRCEECLLTYRRRRAIAFHVCTTDLLSSEAPMLLCQLELLRVLLPLILGQAPHRTGGLDQRIRVLGSFGRLLREIRLHLLLVPGQVLHLPMQHVELSRNCANRQPRAAFRKRRESKSCEAPTKTPNLATKRVD